MATTPSTALRYCLTCQRQTAHRRTRSRFPGAQWRCTEHRNGVAGRRRTRAPETSAR